MALKKTVVGIDIGTLSSSIGVWKGDAISTTTIPSCLAFTNRRMMGDRYSDINAEAICLWPFEVIPGNGDEPIHLAQAYNRLKLFSHEENVCMILMELKEIAENELDTRGVIDAVVSVPSVFNSFQRFIVMRAARMAGINVLQLFSETAAAALAYRWLNKSLRNKRQAEHSSESRSDEAKKEENVLIFDIGGGTLSVAVVEIKQGWRKFEVKAVGGDNELGGNDMDSELTAYWLDRLDKKLPSDVEKSTDVNRIRSECELARIGLDHKDTAQTKVDNVIRFCDTTFPLQINITRDAFEKVSENLFDICKKEVYQCLKNSKIQVRKVILVGGCSGAPINRKMLKDLCEVTEFWEFENPRLAVVHGATILAESLSGAAVHRLLVSDVTPLSLGVQYTGMSRKTMMHVIPRCTKIPSARWDFKTAADGQGVVKIGVYEESEDGKVGVEEKNLLGYYIFSGIVPAESGGQMPTITVSFAIDHNGILVVSAVAEHNNSSTPLPEPKVMFKIENDSENQQQVEEEEKAVKRRKQQAKDNVWHYVTRHINRRMDEGFSESQKMRLRQAVLDAVSWFDQNELPEVIDSERKLDEFQRRYFLIMHERKYTKGKAVFTEEVHLMDVD